MSSKLIIFLLILSIFAIQGSAQSVGCCCDPVVKNGSFSTKSACDALGYIFIGPPPTALITCGQHCNATVFAPGAGTCGDGVCQASENAQSCPADCGVISLCGSPNYKPAPQNIIVKPVKGERKLHLSFNVPCPADYIAVSRCEGKDCKAFKKIADSPSLTSFTDEDDALEWNTDYTYQVIAHYKAQGDGDAATIVGNAGDIECSQQSSAVFCLSSFAYDRFYDYLARFGYGSYTGSEFNSSFAGSVALAFGTKFNQAWQCNDVNKLFQASPKVVCSSQNKEFCISDENGARCVKKEICDVSFDPFGLYSTPDTCEKGLVSKYCFFDRSTTVVNKCYSCDPRMSCYDYKSEDACKRDNCGAGDCSWNPVFADLGIGVCVDKRYNNCPLCSSKGTAGIENANATNAVWDVCREEKSTALSTQNYPCFFDKDTKVSKSCDEATCADYTFLQCGSPGEGIKLNSDNSLSSSSSDVCGIKVCQYFETAGCVKNAGGSVAPDCKASDNKCEADYFPPITSLIPTGVAGRTDFLNIRIFDKLSRKAPPIDMVSRPGYRTYLCVVNSTSSCSVASAFPIVVNSSKLLVKNLVLKDGQRVLASLAVGNNNIRFFSIDAANNREVVNNITVNACDNCQGPTLLNLTVTGGRLIGSTIYTSANSPTFTLTFDEPAQISFAEISRGGEVIALSQSTSGFLTTHSFSPVSQLNGTYNFSSNAQNQKSILMDPPGISLRLVVDPSLAGVEISPPDGSVLNKTIIDILLNFSRPVMLKSILLLQESFVSPYVKESIPRDITDLFKSADNYTFTAKVGNVTGGKYVIEVNAQGFNLLDVFKQSGFFVATVKPSFRLIKPSFGVTAYSVFSASVETAMPGECRYVYDVPSAPNPDDFVFFKAFSGKNTIHDSPELSIPFGETRGYPLHVYCDMPPFGVSQRSFNITLDPEAPRLIKAFAEPSVIAEQYIPGQNLFVTTLKAQISKPGFCKYSASTSNFEAMDGFFPGFDLYPKQSLSVDVNVTEEKSYSYWVVCKGLNGLTTSPAEVKFSIDTSLPLSVSSNTPEGFGTLNFTIGVIANKHVFCYMGESPDDTTICMGACRSLYAQFQPVTVSSPGRYEYYVKCSTGGGEQSDVIDISVIVDTTPPVMKYVDDTGVLSDPEVSWSQTKVRAAFLAEDADSNISYYLVTLMQDRQVVFSNLVSNVTSGKPFYISTAANGSSFRLVNGKRYFLRVKAVNRVGLESESMDSDGFVVDISQTPPQCLDGDRDGDETDIDCGGEVCDGCEAGMSCLSNPDCATNYCVGNVCKVASCEDGVMNGLESDVDCGGPNCKKCTNDLRCITHNDCSSGYCNLNTNVCTDAPPCYDKVLSEGETDIDCGSSCERCGEGKNCEDSFDCIEGLACDPRVKACTSEPIGDLDEDGISDDMDKCLGTPFGEEVDETGCSLSQKFSLDDGINDKWRMDYFGCIDCPEAAVDADPDNDDLTNLQEFQAGTNPTKKDTDGDWWKDGVELERGYDPLDPASHPPSVLRNFLWFLLVLLILSALGYGGFLLFKAVKEKKPEKVEKPVERPEAAKIAADELARLRSFAKEEALEDKEWIDLEKKIKKKPLTHKKFEAALERLRRIVHKERPVLKDPLKQLRAMLDSLSEERRRDLLGRFKMLRAGLLSKEEMEELFAHLRITAKYYEEHKEELERELAEYGKKHRHKK
ncbi:MAG TPA: hypothetical protein VI612_04205 [Candidatus Nanoarchaeia archaeon]|nr:hypothetical protein [Candidatus Nanoarchaeia archaeon]